jgi:hypothetical protein
MSQRREALVDFFDGQLDLLLANGMRSAPGLLLEIQPRELQRLCLAFLLGVDLRTAAGTPPPFGFQFFHALLNPRIRVDESFSCVTHSPHSA